MNKFILTIFINVIIFISKNEGSNDCGPTPKKMLPFCCKGVDKIFTNESYMKCMSKDECDGKMKEDNYCCLLYCMTKSSGILKDDEIDKDTAYATMHEGVGNDPKWASVLKNITEECSNPNSKYVVKPGPNDKDCTTFVKGHFGACLFHFTGHFCPTPIESEECDEVRKHSECIMKKHMENSESPVQN